MEQHAHSCMLYCCETNGYILQEREDSLLHTKKERRANEQQTPIQSPHLEWGLGICEVEANGA